LPRCPICHRRVVASCGDSPPRTPPSLSASAKRYTNAGPLPESAVTASSSASPVIETASPQAAKSLSVSFKSAGVACAPATATDMPLPIRHGVFGMTRTTRVPRPSPCSSRCSGKPAAIDTNSFFGDDSSRISSSTCAMICGLTASTIVFAPRTSARLSRVVSIL
jgi:hypothetical protein